MAEKCLDDCAPPAHTHSLGARAVPALTFSSIPFIFTFIAVSIAVDRWLFPFLSGQQTTVENDEHYLPSDAPPSLRQSHSEYGSRIHAIRRRVVRVSFSTTFALAFVLGELIFCEISNIIDPSARSLALKFTIPTLLFLLIVLIPFLEIQSIIQGAGWEFRVSRGRIPRMPWILQFTGFIIWLMMFWWLGKSLPGTYVYDTANQAGKSMMEACLERVGVVGISMMAILSGFAAISSPWQTLKAKSRPVTETELLRKQAGLDATIDMLGSKRNRLRVLQRKMSDAPQTGLITKFMGSIRGDADAQEVSMLQQEISGLETMSMSLSSSLAMLQARRSAARAASTPMGRFWIVSSYGFSMYCLYRILATSLTTVRRWWSTEATFSDTDPINRFLGLLAKHWDPHLNQAAWSRQISFALSGVILLASFNSSFQTFHLFAKWMPGLRYQTQANLALIIAQISATYVISSALLLRSNLPREVGSVISEALGSPLEASFVDRWFESWFLFSVIVTSMVIFLGKKLGNEGEDWEDWDDYGDVEMGPKRS